MRRRVSSSGRRRSARRRGRPRSGSTSRRTPTRGREPRRRGPRRDRHAHRGRAAQWWERLSREEGVFCEPASAAGVAALAQLGVSAGQRTAVAIVTGHGLKDTGAVDQSSSATVDATLEAVLEALGVIARERHPRRPRISARASTPRRRRSTSGTRLSFEDGRRSPSRSRAKAPTSCRATRRISRSARSRSSRRPSGYRFRFVNRIPLERGLGSSAAAIGARARRGRRRRGPARLLPTSCSPRASASKGTPTTSPPCCTAACASPGSRTAGRARARIAVDMPADAGARDSRVAYEHRALAQRPAFDGRVTSDAAVNAGAAALLGAAIAAGDAALLRDAFQDRLHEQYRARRRAAARGAARPCRPPARSASRSRARARRSSSGPTSAREAEVTQALEHDRLPPERRCSRFASRTKELTLHERLRQDASRQATQCRADRRCRPRAGARDAEGRRLHRRRPREAADRRGDDVDRDDAVQPEPPAARAATSRKASGARAGRRSSSTRSPSPTASRWARAGCAPRSSRAR